MLYRDLGLAEFMNLALAIYPTLLRHRMVPEITPRTLVRIINDACGQGSGSLPDGHTAAARMPVELWLQIAGYVEPEHSLALVFALGPRFWRLARPPSSEMTTTLRTWSRRSF